MITPALIKDLKENRARIVAKGGQVSISPIFYEQLFCAKVYCAAFMCLQFRFVIFWQKDFGAKAALKMLVKLTPGQRQPGQCAQERPAGVAHIKLFTP